jgi:hypothetical protein
MLMLYCKANEVHVELLVSIIEQHILFFSVTYHSVETTTRLQQTFYKSVRIVYVVASNPHNDDASVSECVGLT